MSLPVWVGRAESCLLAHQAWLGRSASLEEMYGSPGEPAKGPGRTRQTDARVDSSGSGRFRFSLRERARLMRVRLLVLALGAALVPLAGWADEPKKDDKAPAVKEIDLKGLMRRPPQGGDVNKPTEITSAEDLAKALPEEEVLARVKKEVDF